MDVLLLSLAVRTGALTRRSGRFAPRRWVGSWRPRADSDACGWPRRRELAAYPCGWVAEGGADDISCLR